MEDKKAHDLAVVMAKAIMGNDFREEKTEPVTYAFCLENWDRETDYTGSYESERLALEQAEIEILDADDEILIGTKVFVGEENRVNLPEINGDDLIEDMIQYMYKEYGDWADGYLEDVKDEHIDVLENALNLVFENWAKKYNYLPNFNEIVNVKTYVYDGAKWVLDNA